MRLLLAPGILLWLYAGFLLGFADARDWFWFNVIAVGSAWCTAAWAHERRTRTS